jgi:hypothetical protein
MARCAHGVRRACPRSHLHKRCLNAPERHNAIIAEPQPHSLLRARRSRGERGVGVISVAPVFGILLALFGVVAAAGCGRRRFGRFDRGGRRNVRVFLVIIEKFRAHSLIVAQLNAVRPWQI